MALTDKQKRQAELMGLLREAGQKVELVSKHQTAQHYDFYWLDEKPKSNISDPKLKS